MHCLEIDVIQYISPSVISRKLTSFQNLPLAIGKIIHFELGSYLCHCCLKHAAGINLYWLPIIVIVAIYIENYELNLFN